MVQTRFHSWRRASVPLAILLASYLLAQPRSLTWYELLVVSYLIYVFGVRKGAALALPMIMIALLAIILNVFGIDTFFALVLWKEFLRENVGLAYVPLLLFVIGFAYWVPASWRIAVDIVRSRRTRRTLLALIPLLVGLGAAKAMGTVNGTQIAFSPGAGLVRGLVNSAPLFGRNAYEPLPPAESAFGAYLAGGHPPADKLLLVMVESGDLATELEAADLGARGQGEWRVLGRGRVPFSGSTIHGEIRELCGLRITSIDQFAPPACAGLEMLGSTGYAVSAWHGGQGAFYRRNIWWPAIGFGKEVRFLDHAPRASRGCSAMFDGACDSYLLARALDWMMAPGKRFAYVLTLDTHFPIQNRRLLAARAIPAHDCGDAIDCALRSHAVGMLEQIADHLSGRPEVLDVVLVSDHSYPKGGYAYSGEVGYTLLRRVGDRAAPAASSAVAVPAAAVVPAAVVLPATAAGPAASAAPLRITRGGTYSGSWSSRQAGMPAVSIETTERVVLEKCRMSGSGHIVEAKKGNADLTIRNCTVTGQAPRERGTAPGRFLNAMSPRSVVVENNAIEGTGGIYIDGRGKPVQLVRVRFNSARNIDGRKSDGGAGYEKGSSLVQFVQLNAVHLPKGGEIAWNKVVNEPGKSRVEDVINIYRSRGSKAHPLLIRNNLIDGAYPEDPEKSAFSGGGIIIDGSAKNAAETSAHVVISGNTVLSTSNYGIAVAAGHDVEVSDNRLAFSGRLDSGEEVASANVGLYVWDFYAARKNDAFGRHVVTRNTVGWTNARGRRNDFWFRDCAAGSRCGGNESIRQPIDKDLLAAERRAWEAKARSRAVKVGPVGGVPARDQRQER